MFRRTIRGGPHPTGMQSHVTSPSQAAQCYAVSCYFSLSGRLVLGSIVLLLPQAVQCYAVSCYFFLSGRPVLCSLVLLRVTSQAAQCFAVSCYFSLSGRLVLGSIVLLLPFRPPSVMQSRATSCYLRLSGQPTNNHQSVCDTPCHGNQ